MRTDTAANIINKVLLELALATSAVSSPYASNDGVVAQLRALLEALGQDLVFIHSWTHLQRQHTFPTAAGTGDYALPEGFLSVVPQTQWNRTTNLEMAGAASPSMWALLTASTAISAVTYFYRVRGQRLLIHPTPSAVETLSYDYNSALWVAPEGEASPTSEAPSADTDVLWFDRRLLVDGLKLRWLEAKGFEATAAQRAYDASLAAAMGGDGFPGELNLSGGALRLGPVLPETGWGS